MNVNAKTDSSRVSKAKRQNLKKEEDRERKQAIWKTTWLEDKSIDS